MNNEVEVSKVARICSIIDEGNKTEWIAKATELSKHELEREVAKACPGKAKRPSTKSVADEPDALHAGLKAYLQKHDPEQNAKRTKKHSARADKPKPAWRKDEARVRDSTSAAEYYLMTLGHYHHLGYHEAKR